MIFCIIFANLILAMLPHSKDPIVCAVIALTSLSLNVLASVFYELLKKRLKKLEDDIQKIKKEL